MVNIRVRQSESLQPSIVIFPDLVWDAAEGYSDLSINDKAELQHENAIWTAVIIQLFTDLRAEEADNLSESDPRGWVGDTFDMTPQDTPLGSHIWKLYRSALTDDVIRSLEQYINLSMDVLVDQQLISNYELEIDVDKNKSLVKVGLDIFANYTQEKYNKQFEILWGQIYGD